MWAGKIWPLPEAGPAAGPPGAAALAFSSAIAGLIAEPRNQDLSGQLTDLAARIGDLPGIEGAFVVAFDDWGDPLAAGSCRLHLRWPSLQGLFKICLVVGPLLNGDWFPAPAGFPITGQTAPLWGFPLGRPGTLGLLLVAAPEEAALAARAVLEECRVLLAAAIRSFLQTEARCRIERLQDLARKTFRHPGWKLDKLPQRLARLFRADAVTLLVEELGELRLAASTDPRLGQEGAVVYTKGQGLTGSIFASGRPLRLNDTRDTQDIWQRARIRREHPSHPEKDERGEVIYGQFLGVPMLFEGKVVGVLRMSRRGVAARFTAEDQKALQFFADLLGAALARSWDLLVARSVFESVSEAVVVSRREPDGKGGFVPRVVTLNTGARKQLRLEEPGEIHGQDARQLYVPGEYEKIRQSLSKSLAEAKVKGRAEFGPIPSRILRPDGTQVPVMISYRVLASERVSPPSYYVMGLARETSESERLAARHRRVVELLNALDIVYFQADLEGVTIEPNATESRITGYSVAELETMNREKLYAEPARRVAFLEEARKHEGRLSRRIQRMRRKNGSTFWAEGDVRIVRDFEGRETGVEGLYRDRTDRLQLQGFLNADTEKILEDHELFSKLKASAELTVNYLMSLGHQLQTPLGSLIETLRNFEKGITNEQQLSERLPYAIGQAVVCSRLVRSLSYMDKILREEPFDRESVSLSRLVYEIRFDFAHLVREKSLTLSVDQPSLDRLLPWIQGHRELLRQVLVNLVDNAIKYSLAGTEIRLRARMWPQGPALEITNRGFPIRPEDRENIFQRGFRTRQAQALVPHGTGLGLWLVRKIVEAHGSTITCLETVEDGETRTLFRILIPNLVRDPRRRG